MFPGTVSDWSLSRREFCAKTVATLGSLAFSTPRAFSLGIQADVQPKLLFSQPSYGAVELMEGSQKAQFEHCTEILMQLDADSMLKPFRQLAKQTAPGASIGGWYSYNPDYDPNKKGVDGFAPGHSFGQWVSALARAYGSTRNPEIKNKVEHLVLEFEKTITPVTFSDLRFPAYTYDKLLRGLLDSAELCNLKQADVIIEKLTDAFEPHLPPKAVPRLKEWNAAHPNDSSYTWDESYTLPENLYLAYLAGHGDRYLALANRYLEDDTFFKPLAQGENALVGKHAYSYVNALSSSALSYITTGRKLYLDATLNGFSKISEQSFATGGWGPDETFINPGHGELNASLTKTHNSFETPCGSYAHLKLCRYLLRLTGDGKYGDSMERVMYNTVLGALPLKIPGSVFYYMDNNVSGRKVYHADACPCCAGTLPQVASDYGISSYFVDKQGVWVNLFTPSTIEWSGGEVPIKLTQTTSYPLGSDVHFDIKTERASAFALRFRVPAWASSGFKIELNGLACAARTSNGFASLTRTWSNGDTVKVTFDMPIRLEAVDAENPNVVAVLRGPLVLLAKNAADSRFKRSDLLNLKQLSSTEWSCSSTAGEKRFEPFESIRVDTYSTYISII